ncbi:MAG TPA: FHA domain-containing protein [Myxococcota bacterium]|nr:FHA domain-containing protein [Myxococcota bacterium]HQK50463.1 FHA domain-containing protein [Myxococcota bacterium]
MAGLSGWLLIVEDRLGVVSDQREIRDGIVVAGRSRQCDLILPSESVSRRHARFSVHGGRLMLEDLGSSNGIWIGEERVQEPRFLQDGEVLRIGEFRIRVQGPRVPAAEALRVRLVGRSPGVRDQVTEVSQDVVMVGRGRDCALVLLDPSVSRNHARLLARMDGSVIVEDLDSANGVFVNDSRVRARELANGDLLRFGDVEFLVELPEAGTIRSRRGRLRRAWRLGIGALVVGALVVGGVAWWSGRKSMGEGVSTEASSSSMGGPSSVPEAATPGPEAPGAGHAPEAAAAGSPEVVRDAAGTLEEARRMLDQRRLDDAERLVRIVLEDHPLDPSAVRVENRLQRERRAAEALASSDRDQAEGRWEPALQALFSIPRESAFFEDVRSRLRALMPALGREKARACRGGSRTVACIRWKALLQKVASTLQ